jgi:hypothetical protein
VVKEAPLMRRVTRLALAALLLAVLPFVASCGDGGGNKNDFISFGAEYYAIPYLDPVFENEVIGFKNLTQTDTEVEVTAFTALGGLAGPELVEIPANGETRRPVADFLGGLGVLHVGGWLLVDTTPGPAVGRVTTYIDRFNSDNQSSEAGATFREGPVASSLSPFAQSYQIINHSDDGGPVGITYEVAVYDAAGAEYSMEDVDVPANGAVTTSVPFAGFLGQVVVTPKEIAGGGAIGEGVAMTSLSVKEIQSSVLTERRLVEGIDSVIGVQTLGFDIDYGFDYAGNAFDFALVISNPTSRGQVVTLNNIFAADGTELLPVPVQLILDPYQSKYYRQRTIDCRGLDDGEFSPFDPIFTDLGMLPAFQQYTFVLSAPREVNTNMRIYDSVFDQFFMIRNGSSRLSTRVNVTNVPVQSEAISGVRNWIDISNPFAGPVEAFPTVTTPGGTVYVLDPVTIPGRARVSFSPDGEIFREDPFDPTDPPVPFISVEISSVGGLFYNARKTSRRPLGVIEFLRPSIVRNETFE